MILWADPEIPQGVGAGYKQCIFVVNSLPRGSYGIPLRSNTVNSENFARVVFSRNFAKIKPTRYVKQSFSFTDVGKSYQRHDF